VLASGARHAADRDDHRFAIEVARTLAISSSRPHPPASRSPRKLLWLAPVIFRRHMKLLDQTGPSYRN
jgi:hypothetical protein